MSTAPRWLKLGKVGKAHGITGAFFVSDRDDPWPKNITAIRIGMAAESGKPVRVIKSSVHGGRVVLSCAEITVREKISELTGQGIWCEAAAFASEKVGDVRWEELLGAQVLADDGAVAGEIADIYDNGRHLNLTLQHPQHGRVDVPYIDTYVQVQHLAPGKVKVQLVVPLSTFAELWEK